MATNPSYPDHDSTTTSSDDDPIEVTQDNRFGILPRAVAYANISVMAKAVYGVLAQFNVAFPSHKFIAGRLGVSVSTVQRAIRELVEGGFLAVEHRYSEVGGQRSNVYHLGGMTYAPPGHARPVPPVTHDHPPRSPMTDVSRQEERDKSKRATTSGRGVATTRKEPFRTSTDDWLELAKEAGDGLA